MTQLDDQTLRLFRRFNHLALLAGVVLLGCVAKSVYLAGPGRERVIAQGEAFARIDGEIPAARGRILDKNGVTLAWSELYFDLHATEQLDEHDVAQLAPVFPQLTLPRSGVVRRHLKPSQIVELEKLIKDGLPVVIRSRSERIAVSQDAVRQKLGEVVVEDGVMRGVSGYEQQFDEILRGTPGRFRVLRDRFHHWIPKSFELWMRPIPGQDIRLDVDLAWLEKEGK